VLVGQLFAERFEIEAIVGSGGMGVVLAARDRATGRRVALKVLADAPAAHPARDRFLQEGRMLADLGHPGIVRHVAHGLTAAGELYLAMEWLEGESLAERLRAGAVAVDEVIVLGRRVAEALAHAHAAGIIHRDVKPSNIFLVGGEVNAPKLNDFGVARFARAAPRTLSGVVVGTPDYMSPEQAAGRLELDARADLYALGCVLYECLTRRRPFTAASAAALFAEIAFEEAPRVAELAPDVPPFLDALVARLLSKRPEDRPGSAEEVVQALGERGAAAAVAHLGHHEQRLASIVVAAFPEDARPAELGALAARYGARAATLIDGSFVATLTGFTTATDLAAQAARCALAVHAARPDARVAAATGRSVLGGRVPVGEAIERAVALTERPAAAFGVRVDDITAGLLDARFEVAGDDEGLTVIAERDLDEPARRLLGKSVPCLGRERELATLDGLLAECIDEPMGQAVLVTGPPGVGKSRLRFELLARAAARGVQVWMARGDPMRAGSPYGLVADLVRHAVGLKDDDPPAIAAKRVRARAGRHLPRDEARRVARFLCELVGVSVADKDPRLQAARDNPAVMGDQIQRAWDDLVAAEVRAGPLVLVLEDLHWGDVPSVRLLDSALRLAEDGPLLVLALARPDVHTLFPRLWAGRRTHVLRLDELRRRASESLVRAALGDGVDDTTVASLVTLSGGNVFHLEELIRAVAEGKMDRLPETVLAMAHARLESLEPEARQLLRAASVFGDSFWPGGVRALVGDDGRVDEWIEDLVHREVLTARAQSRFAREREYSFRHALVREAADAALTAEDRRLGHRLAAAWLEAAGEREPMVLAEHWERAGDPRAAVRFYLAAAEQALRGNDLTAALDRAERGVTCGAEGEVLGGLHLVRAEAYRWQGDFVAAARAGSAAVTHLTAGSARWHLAVGELATCSGLLGQHDRLVSLAAALRATAAGPSAPLIVAGARAAVQLLHAGRFAMGGELLDWLDGLAARLEERDPTVAGWLGRARTIQSSKVGDWLGVLTHAAASADELEDGGDVRTAVLQRMNQGDAQTHLGRYVEGERTLRGALAQAERLGLSHVIAPCKEMLGQARAGQGALADAMTLAAEAAALFRSQGDRRMEAQSAADVALYLDAAGRAGEALPTARSAVETAPSPAVRAACLAVLADVLLSLERPGEALAAAAEGMDILERDGTIDERETALRLVHARALLATGDTAAATTAIAAARRRLLDTVGKLRDPALRETALAAVRENAATLALAERLGR
jgi:hypothetical protein